jgi:hypothetical protein
MKMGVWKRMDNTERCEIILDVKGNINNSEMPKPVGMIHGKNCVR